MNKKNLAKVTGTSAAAFLIAGTTAFTAFAAMPEGTVVIGNKAFSLDYANLASSVEEIRTAIIAGDGIYIKAPNGTWFQNSGAVLADTSVIPAVEYKAADGTVTKYDVKDGNVVSDTLKVEAVSAINSTSLQVSGTGLAKLTAEDIKVEGITVKSVSASADGKTATVVLESALIVGETVKVTAQEKDYNVTYTVTATGVAIVEGQTYDDDTEDQFVKILVDGKAVTAQELINAGYTVNFEAFTTKAATVPVNIFDGAASTSTTGELLAPIVLVNIADDYYAKVTVSNGSDVMTSAMTKITIKNTNVSADTITGAVLVNTTTGAEQTSSTLVTGDIADFTEINVKSANSTEAIAAGKFTVKSSNQAVVSVDTTTYQLTAQGPGTATLTITYGGTTYTKTITVKNEARKATSVKVNKTSVPVVKGQTAVVKVQLLDQYSDPMSFVSGTDLKVVSSDDAIATADVALGNNAGSLGNPAGAKLEADLTIDGVDTGSAIFTFRNGADTKIGTTSVRATVTDNGAISQYSLAVDNDITTSDVTTLDGVITGLGFTTITKNDVSTDATIDTGSDAYVKIIIKGLNSAGQEIVSTPAAGANYTVTAVNSSDVNVLDTTFGAGLNGVSAQNGYILVKAGTDAGTATITVTDASNANVTKTFKVTTTNVGYSITGVNFKNVAAPTYATTLDVKDFLSYTNSANDLIVTGLTLSKPVSQAIRLDAAGSILYIDKDGDGTNSAGDIEVGSLVISTTGALANNALNADITDAITGLDVASGDDGTVIFKVLNTGSDKAVGGGDDKVIATKAVSVDF